MASSVFTVTFEPGTCWRPDESVVSSVIADPSGWFKAEWAALVGVVEQAYSVTSDQLGWALGVRLARFFLVRGYYDDWRHVCGLMLAGARRAISGGREGMALAGLSELPRLQHRLDEALQGFEQTLTACGAPGQRHSPTVATGHLGATGRIGSTGRMGAVTKSGHFDESLLRLENALTYLRDLADRRSEASAQRRLGTAQRLQRCYEKAVGCFQQVLDALDGFGDPLWRGASCGPGRSLRLAAVQGTPHAGW